MEKITKYWYFRFTKNFFKDKAIRDLKRIPVIGYQLGWIYLEMCALCLEDGSYILKIPKFTQADSYINYIAEEIGEDARIVAQAISYFLKNEFLEIFESDSEFDITFKKMMSNMGKSSADADRKRLASEKRKELQASKKEEDKEQNIFAKFNREERHENNG